MLLLLWHSTKGLNAQEERLATSPYWVTRHLLPHTIVVRLHARNINVVILTPETSGHSWCLSCSLSLSVGFYIQDEAMDVARSAP